MDFTKHEHVLDRNVLELVNVVRRQCNLLQETQAFELEVISSRVFEKVSLPIATTERHCDVH